MKTPLLLLDLRVRVLKSTFDRLLADHARIWKDRLPTKGEDAALRERIRIATQRLEFFTTLRNLHYRLQWN